EEWNDRGGRFDALVAASSWHWVDPSIGWQRAHDVLCPGAWTALLGNVIVRRPGEPEVYAETADLHERFCPGYPGWGHPPLEDDVRMTDEGWDWSQTRQLVRPDDRPVVSGRSVVGRGRLRGYPPLDVAVPR